MAESTHIGHNLLFSIDLLLLSLINLITSFSGIIGNDYYGIKGKKVTYAEYDNEWVEIEYDGNIAFIAKITNWNFYRTVLLN